MASYAATLAPDAGQAAAAGALPRTSCPPSSSAAAAAVVGAIVAEISTGTTGGIGRLIIEYSRQAQTDPAKVYTAMLGAALLGLAFVGAGRVCSTGCCPRRRRPEEAVVNPDRTAGGRRRARRRRQGLQPRRADEVTALDRRRPARRARASSCR